MTPQVNGHPCDPGCWVEGHWGQYAGDHLADKVDHMIDIEPLDDPRILRSVAETTDNMGYPDAAAGWWEIRSEAVEKLTDTLNEHTPPLCTECGRPVRAGDDGFYFHVGLQGDCPLRALDTPQRYVWHWWGGEVFLSPMCDDPDECVDETCAHWD